jgi:hypothetical protein
VNVDQVLTLTGWLTYCQRMSRDILDEFEQQRGQPDYPSVAARVGEIAEDRAPGFCGDIVTITAEAVTLRSKGTHAPVPASRAGSYWGAGHAGPQPRANPTNCH